jgi:zinc finger SWIM domain-containing protein 3
MYLYEKEEKFEEVFKSMRSKVKNGSWLDGIYKLKHKWAYCYMKDVFTLGMRSTQLSESFNKDLKQHLKFNLDIVRFFKHFERAVQEKREKEVKSEHEARKKLPMLKLKGTPVLQQAANVYTPPIFKLFQEEFEKSTAAYIKNSVQNDSINEFTVAICNLEGRPTSTYGYKVSVHPINQTVSCSCKKFEKHGILCSHALKSLDMMNIKLIPEAYILKRWTKEARSDIVQDNNGKDIVEDPKLEKLQRYRSVCKKFARMASRAVDFDESYFLLDSSLDSMSKTIEDKIKEIFKPEDSHEETLDSRVAGLKKREGRKSNKRPKDWVESMQEKAKKKEKKQAKSKQGKSNKTSKSGTNRKKGPGDEVQYYNNNVTTTIQLMAP